MVESTESREEAENLHQLEKGESFIHRLAQYYSDFLSTDFKKGNLPKRRYQTRDKKGRRSGVPIEKFPSLMPKIKKMMAKKVGTGSQLTVKLKEHQAILSPIVAEAIKASIHGLSFSKLTELNANALGNYKKQVQSKEIDLDIETTNFISQLRRNVGVEIGATIIQLLQPVFERSASNLIDALVSVEDDISELLVNSIEDSLPSALASFIGSGNEDQLDEILEEAFSEENSKSQLIDFFETFSAGDLFTELRELAVVEKLEDNLEYYLYLGEIKYQSHQFPIFYIPFTMNLEESAFTLTFDSRVLINKKAIDYIARVVQDETKTTGASVVDERIMYLNPDETYLATLDGMVQKVLMGFQLDGDISFGSSKSILKNSTISLNNSPSFALFDKSDESMLTDYEELLSQLSSGGGDLLDFLNNLVGSFLDSNPTSVVESVLDDWDDMKLADRLVFDTPIPLAEEQRKIINALNKPDAKFVTVEGPPGTGKSHTISAIAFGAILNKQSILILSDKKEALDVVENKLNDTLAKVRPSDDFINPILRLGRVGANFTKLTALKSIEKLRTQHREIKKERGERDSRYKAAVESLKDNISNRNNQLSKIDTDAIFQLEEEGAAFKLEYSDLPKFAAIFEAGTDEYEDELDAIKRFVDLRIKCKTLSSDFLTLCDSFGQDASSLAEAINFHEYVTKGRGALPNGGKEHTGHRTRASRGIEIFDIAKSVTYESLQIIPQKIKEIQEAKGLFGYLFAGEKLKQIKSDLFREIGFTVTKSKADKIIVELDHLRELGDWFFGSLKNKFPDKLHLIDSFRGLEPSPEFDLYLPVDLRALDNAINTEVLPFWYGEETVIEAITSSESSEADFYETFLRLRNKSAAIRSSFDLSDYSYLSSKTQLENYNSLELATEIDGRVIHLVDNYKNDVKTLSQIIRQKKKFPKDKFEILKNAFPCMICSLRDYAEYIPLEKELFDLIIIDEASQVSIAQAFPAIIRAKKIIVLGDRRQFGNVKTSNASKELNNAYFTKLKEALVKERGSLGAGLAVKIDTLNISSSVLDFMDSLSNFSIMLKKHFRGYPEMISFSSKYFYGGDLQAMKIRGKAIGEVLEFIEVPSDGKFDQYKNTNELEATAILDRVLKQLDENDLRSVAVITPFNEQQTYLSRIFSDHKRYQEILDKLHFRCFTFDSCQGEERDIIYYSMVASPEKDKLWTVLPKSLEAQGEEELDRNKRMQRLNVAFSRGKEKLIFVHSKPISEMSAGREVLNHFAAELANAKATLTDKDVDQNSEAEKKVLQWIYQSPVYMEYKPEIRPQFEVGKYLKGLDSKYNHPAYRVDFLLSFDIKGHQRDIILEYDGFEFHFNNRSEIDKGNWRFYQKDSDTERQHVLESFGYKVLRLNKFIVGDDPIQTLSDMIRGALQGFLEEGDSLIKTVLENTATAVEGYESGAYRHCKKCDSNKEISEFASAEHKSGFRRFCKGCSKPTKKKRAKKLVKVSEKLTHKVCPNCSRDFPIEEFNNSSNVTGKSKLCKSCKSKSDARSRAWARRNYGRR